MTKVTTATKHVATTHAIGSLIDAGSAYSIGFQLGLGLVTSFAIVYLIGTVILGVINILAQ